jgi:hypothetical protein
MIRMPSVDRIIIMDLRRDMMMMAMSTERYVN